MRFFTTFSVLATFSLAGQALATLIQPREVDWDAQADKNLVQGCSASETSCYNENKLMSCGQTDWACKCDAMERAVSCLRDCVTFPLAKGQRETVCEAMEVYGSTGGDSDSGDKDDKPRPSPSDDDDDRDDDDNDNSSWALAAASSSTSISIALGLWSATAVLQHAL